MTILIILALSVTSLLLAILLAIAGAHIVSVKRDARYAHEQLTDVQRRLNLANIYGANAVETYKRLGWSLHDIFEHLDDYEPKLPNDRAQLLYEIAQIIPRLPLTHNKPGYRQELDNVSGELPILLKGAEALVQKIDDPTINARWAEGRHVDFYEIARCLVFQRWDPKFNLIKGFAQWVQS